MANPKNQFDPDYAVPPGWVLEERLDAQGMSHAEFARRCGRSPKLISEIISGKAPLEPETALQFEKVLGVDAGIWLGIESKYKLRRARQNEAEAAARTNQWARAFPLAELVRRGIFERPESDADAVTKLLAFFRVGSIDAWTARYGLANVAYRHSPAVLVRIEGPERGQPAQRPGRVRSLLGLDFLGFLARGAASRQLRASRGQARRRHPRQDA